MSEGLASLFESVLFVIFLPVFLEPKCREKRFYFGAVLAAVLLFVNISVSDYFGVFNIYAMITDVIITMVFWRFFLEDSMLHYIIAFALFYFGLYGSSYLAAACFTFLDKDLMIIPAMSIGSSYRLWLLLAAKILLLIYVIIILYHRQKFRYQQNGILALCCAVCPVVVLGIFFMLAGMLIELYFAMPDMGVRMVGIIAGLHIMVVITVLLSLYTVKKQEKEKDVENLNYIMNMQKESLERFIVQENETYKLKHELEHKLFAVQYLFHENKSAEGIRVLQQLIDELCGNAKKMTISENIIDMVIINTEQKYESDGYILEKEISFQDENMMDLVDLCILIGNLADNAIEAAVQSAEGHVQISVKEQYGCLHIKVANTCSKDKSDVIHFVSHKNEIGKHGFGMRNIRETVRRYGGDFTTFYEDGWFYADAVIYGQDTVKYQK